MRFRQSGLAARFVPSRLHNQVPRRRSHFDHLERRQLLAAVDTHASEFASIADVAPTIVRLESPSSKARALISAGAKLFSGVSSVAAARNQATQHVVANSFSPFTIGLDSVKSLLATAPMEFTKAARNPLVLALPTPDGKFARFDVVEAPIMEKGLADRYSYIKTYRGVGIEDPTSTIRLDYTQLGFHAQVLSTNGAYYIDPYFLNDVNGTYLSYYKHDLVATDADKWLCDADADAVLTDAPKTANRGGGDALEITYGGTLKTYRAAVGASYQYTAAVGGGTVAGGQAAVVTAVNRVTGIYETELSIRLTLVANNDSLVYATSTNSFGNTSSVINTSTSKINGIIGVSNYDIGHVFTTASGGVAGLGVVGSSTQKGAGTTGLPSPTGDAFYIDFVAHEMGHQFGGNHTFNTSVDPNRNASTAYEPGSGSTIMAYAGVVGSGEDLQAHSDPYFHAISIQEIRNFITGVIPGVGASSTNSNTAPTVDAGANYTIPTGTPFALTATGSDANGDVVTYDWQEMDLGIATALTTPDNGASPQFRDLIPSTSPTRPLPRLNSILGGSNLTINSSNRPVERLFSVARTSNWRVIARDNRAGGGGVSTDDMQLTVVNTGASFLITNFNSGTTVQGGSMQTLTWNVAGTTGNGINAANVRISLSTNNGSTFPYVLAANTENDGSETIQIPYNISATQGRLKVEAVGNIFFDINNSNLNIQLVTPSSQTPATPLLLTDTGISSSDGLTNRNNTSPASVLQFDIGSTVSGALVELLIDGVVVGSTTAVGTSATITTDGTTAFADGAHTVTARQTEVGKPVSALATNAGIQIDTVAPALVGLPTFNFETDHSLSYAFSESLGSSLDSTDLTVSDGSNTIPATLTYSDGTLSASVNFSGLLANGDYTATLSSSGATDAAGNELATGAPFAFFVLAGDVNRDRAVNFDDLLVLAQNYGSSGATYSAGNLNYDPAGNVDFDDLLILAQAYGTSLPSLVGSGSASGAGNATDDRSPGKRRVAADVL